MATSVPDVIARYFSAQAARDFDTVLMLFADDAVVIDEGQARRGAREIRAWRENVATAYEYTTELRGVTSSGEGMYVAQLGRVLEGRCDIFSPGPDLACAPPRPSLIDDYGVSSKERQQRIEIACRLGCKVAGDHVWD